MNKKYRFFIGFVLRNFSLNKRPKFKRVYLQSCLYGLALHLSWHQGTLYILILQPYNYYSLRLAIRGNLSQCWCWQKKSNLVLSWFFIVLPLENMFLSSGNIIGFKHFPVWHKFLVQIIISYGPRFDVWGIPYILFDNHVFPVFYILNVLIRLLLIAHDYIATTFLVFFTLI